MLSCPTREVKLPGGIRAYEKDLGGVAHTTGRRLKATALGVALCVVAAGCGGAAKRAPTQQDANAIATSVSEIVYECQSVAAGFIATPNNAALARDVKTLLHSYRQVRPGAPFALDSASGATFTTTLHREVTLAESNLASGCARWLAARLRSAAG